MPLTCHCGYDDHAWYYEPPRDYTVMPERGRRARCSSCKSLLNTGDTVTRFPRSRPPRAGVEENIYGEQSVRIADMWLCETCSDLWFSLLELGFECVSPDENIRELVREYAEWAQEYAK